MRLFSFFSFFCFLFNNFFLFFLFSSCLVRMHMKTAARMAEEVNGGASVG